LRRSDIWKTAASPLDSQLIIILQMNVAQKPLFRKARVVRSFFPMQEMGRFDHLLDTEF
jgi:hypothetical protein